MIHESDYLQQLGFNPLREFASLSDVVSPEDRITLLRRNLESFTNEVLMDEPVSRPYRYYLDAGGAIYTDPSLAPIYDLTRQIDTRERNGLYLRGITESIQLARHYPDDLVGLYSPPGPASFAETTDDSADPFRNIRYTYGQLYLFRWDGAAIDALAVKLNGDGHRWAESTLDTVMDSDRVSSLARPPLARLARAIQTPIHLQSIAVIDGTIPTGTILYTAHSGREYSWEEIRTGTMRALRGESPDLSGFLGSVALPDPDSQLTAGYVAQAYYAVMERYAREQGLTKLVLSGSCGGSEQDIASLEEQLGLRTDLSQNPFDQLVNMFGSDYRILTTGESSTTESKSCVHCGGHDGVICGVCKACAKTKFSE